MGETPWGNRTPKHVVGQLPKIGAVEAADWFGDAGQVLLSAGRP